MMARESPHPASVPVVKRGLKCVVVGDRAAEKNVLLFTYTTKEFPSFDPPVSFTGYMCLCVIAGCFDYMPLE